MAQTAMKVTAVSIEVEDKPGVAAQIMATLREAGINLKALAGWSKGDGHAVIMAIPEDLAALRALAAQEGVETTEKALVWVEGLDEMGALCDLTAKLAGENINIVTSHALGVGGNFAAVFSFESEQIVDQVVQLVGG